MDYEKKYKEALERAKHSDGIYPSAKELKEYILPELRESVDERIRKDLIFWINSEIPQCSIQEHADKLKQFSAWLKSLRPQPKQEWNEEDEIKETIRCALLSCCNGSAINYKLPYDGYEKCLSWLKSLRPQSQWKPSDEQIKAVRLARSFVTDDFSDNPTLSEILIELEEQLKKLREG